MGQPGACLRLRARALSSALLLFLAAALRPAAGLELELQHQTKCVLEDIAGGVLVVGDFYAFHRHNRDAPVSLDVQVEDPHSKVLYRRTGQASGQFAFTTPHAGDYKACFTVLDPSLAPQTLIQLDWKTGVAATDWDAVAKKENLNEVATELRRLEQTVAEIHTDMLLLRHREEEMRNLSESTNARVAWFSVGSLGVCVSLTLWQLYYLKSFFRRKKLL